MNSKTCSVIVPIYNAAPYLAQCLSSIKMQTYTDLQVILVDDGSTDNSAAIAQSYVDADKRFTLYHEPNQGQSVARNMAMKKAIGEYLVFVDADDYLDNDFVARHIAAIGQADYVQSGYKRVKEDGAVLVQKTPCHRYQFTSPCMRLYRRAYLRQHHLSFAAGMIYEDVVFSLHLWNNHPKVTRIDYRGYNYLYNPQSTTSKQHLEARQQLFSTIRRMDGAPWLKIYTLLRLYAHFLRYKS